MVEVAAEPGATAADRAAAQDRPASVQNAANQPSTDAAPAPAGGSAPSTSSAVRLPPESIRGWLTRSPAALPPCATQPPHLQHSPAPHDAVLVPSSDTSSYRVASQPQAGAWAQQAQGNAAKADEGAMLTPDAHKLSSAALSDDPMIPFASSRSQVLASTHNHRRHWWRGFGGASSGHTRSGAPPASPALSGTAANIDSDQDCTISISVTRHLAQAAKPEAAKEADTDTSGSQSGSDGKANKPWKPYEASHQENFIMWFLPRRFYQLRWLLMRNPLAWSIGSTRHTWGELLVLCLFGVQFLWALIIWVGDIHGYRNDTVSTGTLQCARPGAHPFKSCNLRRSSDVMPEKVCGKCCAHAW